MYFQGILPYAICYHSTIFNYMKKKKKEQKKAELFCGFECKFQV